MTFEKTYNLNREEIKEVLQPGKSNVQCNKYKLFPFIANDTKLVEDFKGVNGAFSRIVSNKSKVKSEKIDMESIIEEIKSNVEASKDEKVVIQSIIQNVFFDDEKNLINFDIRVLNYLETSSFEEKIASFLYSILLDNNLQKDILKLYEKDVDNIMYKLILDCLPTLEENKGEKSICWNSNFNVAKKYFSKDIVFLLKNEELYNQNIKRILEYYYLFYVSQVSFKLNKFEKADLDKVEKVYYTLNTEKSVGKNRKTYNLGFKMLEKSMENLFTHAITLEFLNMSNFDKSLNYIELSEHLDEENSEEFKNSMIELIKLYKERWNDLNWDNLKFDRVSCEKEGYDLVYELFETIDYQFKVTQRIRPYKAYSNWIVKFMQKRFGKTRGATGYTLSLSEEDIILFTKLIMKDLEKMKLKSIFEEFEERGIFFDKDSKIKVLQLYEKLNIIEKKSDSGDAIYVKTIL